jgi:hypothetical protein
MTGPRREEITPEHLEGIRVALTAGVAALTYITRPVVWPRFAAWSEAISGQPWSMTDRLAFDRDRAILALMGGLEDDPGNAR